jgi:hypothetical protein
MRPWIQTNVEMLELTNHYYYSPLAANLSYATDEITLWYAMPTMSMFSQIIF